MIITIPFEKNKFRVFQDIFYNVPFGRKYFEIEIENNIVYFKIKNYRNEIVYKVILENKTNLHDSFILDNIDTLTKILKLFSTPVFNINFQDKTLTIKENDLEITFDNLMSQEKLEYYQTNIDNPDIGEMPEKSIKTNKQFPTESKSLENIMDKEDSEGKPPTIFKIKIEDFLKVIKYLHISVDDFIYDMSYIYSEYVNDNILRFYSTNNYIFSLIEIPYQKISESINHFFILNGDYYYYLYKLLRKRQGDLQIQITIDNKDNLKMEILNNDEYNNLSFVFERRKKRHFLSYRNFFSLVDLRTYVQFNKTKLINLLRKTINTFYLKITIDNDKTMNIQFFDKYTLNKVMEIDYEIEKFVGQPVTFYIKDDFLYNILKLIPHDIVQMKLIDESHPVIFNGHNEMNNLKHYYVVTTSISE